MDTWARVVDRIPSDVSFIIQLCQVTLNTHLKLAQFSNPTKVFDTSFYGSTYRIYYGRSEMYQNYLFDEFIPILNSTEQQTVTVLYSQRTLSLFFSGYYHRSPSSVLCVPATTLSGKFITLVFKNSSGASSETTTSVMTKKKENFVQLETTNRVKFSKETIFTLTAFTQDAFVFPCIMQDGR